MVGDIATDYTCRILHIRMIIYLHIDDNQP
jgi:hypothetical protein